jgi:hypothetical protein
MSQELEEFQERKKKIETFRPQLSSIETSK